jgi:gamma-glutamylcyclotransferase (GGCT)/AIG2-like uncharacterized protein YtfP
MSFFPVDQVTTLFVYGTFQPGDERWHHLEPFVDGGTEDVGEPDTVDGSLYDTGQGYPAAVFDHRAEPGGVVHGLRIALRADTLGEALGALDAEEASVTGLFRRTLVTTHAGLIAWAYQYGDGLDLTPIAGGRWNGRPR